MQIIDVTKNKDLVVDSFGNVNSAKLVKCPIIVVYEDPRDYPSKFVARLFNLAKPTKFIAISDSLEEVRKAIPPTMVWFERFREDDEKVVECYM